jgi:hypothetical protein
MSKAMSSSNQNGRKRTVFETAIDLFLKERAAGLATKPSQQQTTKQAPTPRVAPTEAITYSLE